MRKFLRILSIILLVLWMGIIFFFSSQTADDSSKTSGQVIEVIAEKFYPEYSEMTDVEREEFVSSLQFVVRKSTHIGAFAVLGFLAFLTFIGYVNLRFTTRIFWALAISLLYAASDEFHQRYVVGRSCELRDFLLDSAGILAAILMSALFIKILSPLRRKTAFVDAGKQSLMNLNDELCHRLDKAQYRNKTLEDELKEYKATVEKLEFQLQQMEETVKTQEETVKIVETVPETEVLELEEKISPTEEVIAPVEIKSEEETLSEETLSEEICEPEIVQEKAEEIEEKTETVVASLKTKSRNMSFSNEVEYASKVIGECVVEVTKVCNKLTEGVQDETKKELVNLALGRNEVLKSKILKIISMEIEFSQKIELIENERKEAFDYFDSIIAQIS